MGKKGSWFSAIKKVFTHSSKEKVAEGTEKKSSKEEKKKKGFGKFKNGDGRSFIPLFREPSSIEKILEEAEREVQVNNYKPLAPRDQPKDPPNVTVPPPLSRTVTPQKVGDYLRTSSPPTPASPPRNATHSTPRPAMPPSQRGASPPQVATQVNTSVPAKASSTSFVQRYRSESTLKEQHSSAVKIQAAYRGYMARRSHRAVKGLARLQEVVKGRSVKRQITNTLKCMQLLVRVQTQIQSRRIQMYEDQAVQRQALYKNDKDQDSIFSKWNSSENQDEWVGNTLTREEYDARMRRKVEAMVNREKAMAYAHSHQTWKSTPRKAAHSAASRFSQLGLPYWWNWFEQRQLPPKTPSNHSQPLSVSSFRLTPTRPSPDFKLKSPLSKPTNIRHFSLELDNFNTPSPRSTKSAIPSKLAHTPPGRLQQKFTRASAANSPFNGVAFRDNDSLTSCPAFTAPRYMSPTVSAKAKVKDGKELFPDSPRSTATESKRRVSFPLGRDFSWSRGLNKEGSSQKSMKNQSPQSIGSMSVNSTVSMPARVGRKPFNRFA